MVHTVRNKTTYLLHNGNTKKPMLPIAVANPLAKKRRFLKYTGMILTDELNAIDIPRPGCRKWNT